MLYNTVHEETETSRNLAFYKNKNREKVSTNQSKFTTRQINPFIIKCFIV